MESIIPSRKMIERPYLEEIKRTKRMKLKFQDYFGYVISIMSLGLAFIGFILAVDSFKHYLIIRKLLPAIIFISLGLLFLYFSLKRLNDNVTFETIDNRNNLRLDELKVAIENKFRINKVVIDKELEMIELWTKVTAFSWGERITIIKNGNTYLVNSKPDGLMFQPITIYKDRKNIIKIKRIITT